jgi:ABC-type multidrug transport system fused ATPase/permease subunit
VNFSAISGISSRATVEIINAQVLKGRIATTGVTYGKGRSKFHQVAKALSDKNGRFKMNIRNIRSVRSENALNHFEPQKPELKQENCGCTSKHIVFIVAATIKIWTFHMVKPS